MKYPKNIKHLHQYLFKMNTLSANQLNILFEGVELRLIDLQKKNRGLFIANEQFKTKLELLETIYQAQSLKEDLKILRDRKAKESTF